MKKIKYLSLMLVSVLLLASCGSKTPENSANTIESEVIEDVSDNATEDTVSLNGDYASLTLDEAKAIYLDSEITVEERIKALLSQMTLEEKAYQCVQPEQAYITVDEVKKYGVGSILSGGGSAPTTGNNPENWEARINELINASLETRLGIPVLYGLDAVHGNNNIFGATVFPHNIGLGAANDTELMKEIGEVVAREVRAVGAQYTFTACLANPQNELWGRTYEGFSERTDDVVKLATPYIAAMQGNVTDNNYMPVDSVVACAKHYIGEGYTKGGVNQGDVKMTEEEFDELLSMGVLDPYEAAVNANVLTVMPSYNSVNGLKCHENYHLLTEVLKEQLGFKGIVISDYNAIQQCKGSYREQVMNSFNAGVDLFMEVERWDDTAKTIIQLVEAGEITEERLDDAVTRILRVKFMANLFDTEVGNEHEKDLLSQFGSDENREVARKAVRESLVLLKNDTVNGETVMNQLSNAKNIVMLGSAANDMGRQCGGWTISWQGQSGNIDPGTTLINAIYNVVKDNAVLSLSTSGQISEETDLCIAVVGENPYAESNGDTSADKLKMISKDSILLDNFFEDYKAKKSTALKVLVIYAGRPINITDYVDEFDAIIMAFLPGTEGEGMADVMFGDYDFTGTLSYTWVKDPQDIEYKFDLPEKDILYSYGYGLNKNGELLERK